MKTLGRYAAGDIFFLGHGGSALSGRVEKIGRKYVTIVWEDFMGYCWTTKWLPDRLDAMCLSKGDAEQTPWDPQR